MAAKSYHLHIPAFDIDLSLEADLSKLVLDVSGLHLVISTVDVAMLPATPSDLIVTVVSGTRLDLRWTANGTSENYFILERAPSGTTSWAEISRPSHGVTTYSDTGLTPGNAYIYRIKAHNSEGDSSYSPTATGTTSGVAPTAPSSLSVSAINDTLIRLDWTDNSDNEASFIIERSPNGTDTWTTFTAQPANAITFDDDTVSASTTYYYRVKARNVVGDSAYTSIVSGTTPPTASAPAAPSGLTATAISASRIDLAWTDNSADETGFVIERSLNGVSGWMAPTPTTAPNVTSYSDTGLTDSTPYWFRVKATNAYGDSAYTSVVSATTLAAGALSPPTGLYLVTNKGTNAVLGWSDNTGGTASTEVEYGEVGAGFAPAGTVGPGVESLFTQYMIEDTNNQWRARAIDGLGGLGDWSTTLTAYTSPKQPGSLAIAGTAPRQAVVYWLDVSFAETGYEIRWSLTGANDWTTLTTAANVHDSLITGLTPGEDYDVQGRSLGAHSNNSSWTATVTLTTPAETLPAAPSNVHLVAVTPNRLDAHWTRNSTNENEFEVQYCGDAAGAPDGTWLAAGSTWPEVVAQPIGSLASTTPYWTRVRAVNGAGASAWVESATAGTTPAANDSPTGREPVLAWTSARQSTLEQMKADYDASPAGTTLAIKLYARLVELAGNVGTAAQLSSGNIPLCALMYQITGDLAWGEKGSAGLTANAITLEPYSDPSRENFAELVLAYDWLYPAMTPFERSLCVAAFHSIAQGEIANYAGTDSDQTTGASFGGIAMLAHSAAVLDDPTLGDYLNDSKIGGLDATAVDQTTARNSMKAYLTRLAVGGEWCESSEYNLGTTRLLAMVYAGLKTATAPTDHLPEVAAELENLAKIPLIQLTPALNQAIQWGDNQNARTPDWSERVCTLGMLAGNAKSTPGGEYALKAYHERMIVDAWSGGHVFGRTLLLIDPYATETDWRSTFLSHYASGQGNLYVHDGWSTNDSLFFARFERRSPFVDHSLHHWGCFQLWRKGEWALTNPIGYWNNYKVGEWISLNQMGVGGLSWFAGNRDIINQETVEGSHAYIAGYSDGKFFGLTEPEFCHENQRSLVYLPSTAKTSDVIVVFDRVDAEAPLSLSTSGQIDSLYGSPWASRIKDSPFGGDGLKQWTIHAPVAPTNGANTITWDTTGGQHVRVDALLPASVTITNYDETTVLSGTDFGDSEKKWQARIKPATDQQWDTFLNVVQVYDSGSQPTITLIQSSAGQTYQGALIERSGDDDHVLMFGARANAGNRLITTGSTFGWTQGTATAKVLMFDLDPAKTWTYSLDGGGAVSLTISGGGVAELTVNTAAAHTLVLTGV